MHLRGPSWSVSHSCVAVDEKGSLLGAFPHMRLRRWRQTIDARSTEASDAALLGVSIVSRFRERGHLQATRLKCVLRWCSFPADYCCSGGSFDKQNQHFHQDSRFHIRSSTVLPGSSRTTCEHFEHVRANRTPTAEHRLLACAVPGLFCDSLSNTQATTSSRKLASLCDGFFFFSRSSRRSHGRSTSLLTSFASHVWDSRSFNVSKSRVLQQTRVHAAIQTEYIFLYTFILHLHKQIYIYILLYIYIYIYEHGLLTLSCQCSGRINLYVSGLGTYDRHFKIPTLTEINLTRSLSDDQTLKAAPDFGEVDLYHSSLHCSLSANVKKCRRIQQSRSAHSRRDQQRVKDMNRSNTKNP